MIEQQGLILFADRSTVRVRLGATSGCPACDGGRGCGAGIFGRLLPRRPTVMDFGNTLGARTGQAVVVGLPESLYLRLLTRFYLLPLLAGLGGAVFGHNMSIKMQAASGVADLLALAAALLAGSAALIWGRERARDFPGRETVQLLRVVEAQDGRSCGRAATRAAAQGD
ncbi:MAG: SoxR reducing system RseC family protein [Xanthomonadales bacterium]|nr:SoxR reducing system RseC family protein [Xanthomonadales bacterium]